MTAQPGDALGPSAVRKRPERSTGVAGCLGAAVRVPGNKQEENYSF